MTPEQEVLADLIAAARAITASAREAMPLAGRPPVDDLAFAAMTPMQRMSTTALLKLSEQLEGTLSALFRAILRSLGVRIKGLYPLDIANRMVELDILDKAEDWLAIVKLRNELVHEYPLGSSKRYTRFVGALNALPFLFEAVERAARVVGSRGLLGSRA